MKKSIVSVAAVAALLIGAELPEYEVSPKIGGVVHEGDSKLESSLYGGLGLGIKYSEDIMLTLGYLHSASNYKNLSNEDTGVDVLYLNPEYYFLNEDGRFKPYLTTGIGYQWLDNNLMENEDRLFFNYGAGLKYFMENFSLGFEAKHFTSFDDGTNALWYGASVGIPFYGKSESKPMAKTEKPMATPPVRPEPAPEPPKVPKLPLDIDKDGVVDSMDQCPDTPTGFEVNDKGCVDKYKFIVHFDNDKYDLKYESWESITKFTYYLRAHPEKKAEIQGHTDSKADDAYNMRLSLKRAKAVYHALVSQGIDPKRLTYKGFGESTPVVPNDSDENMALNRRVEAKFY